MFSPWTIFAVILSYLLLLFFVAYVAERKELQGKSLVSNPYIYSLSLAVYCTSWTFYGSVGKAANQGLSFLTIYVGPTLMAALWWIVLRKIVIISKENRITTISDFVASRYGKSLSLSALVTFVAVIGITPYLGLQLKAVMTAISMLSGRLEGSQIAGWAISLLLGVFAVMFGARRLDASERHGGLVFAVAFESAIKLLAFLAVGIFVTYGLFHGFGDIFSRISSSRYASLMKLGPGSEVSFLEWTSLTFLSMMAILFLWLLIQAGLSRRTGALASVLLVAAVPSALLASTLFRRGVLPAVTYAAADQARAAALPYYHVLRALNSRASPADTTYLLFCEDYRYYLDTAARGDWYGELSYPQLARGVASEAQLVARLKDAGIRWVVVARDRARTHQLLFDWDFSHSGLVRQEVEIPGARVLYSDRRFGVYQLW